MLFPNHPKSVVDNRPVAVKVVKQEHSGALDKHVLVVDKLAPPAPVPKPKP
jgi:hypothetical protein